jgi:two-component sensor histidine kinase
VDIDETPLDQAICRFGIEKPEMLVIPDLTLDPRTRDNPFVVGDANLRFYAGAPLVSDRGVAIGRLCVIDTAPRPEGLSEDQHKALNALARQVMAQIEQRRAARLADDLAHLQTCLVAVAERIRKSESIADMTYGTAELVGRALVVDRAGYGTVDAATEVVVIEPDWTAPGIAGTAGTYRFGDFGHIRDEIAEGEPLVIDNVDSDPRTASDAAPMHALDIGALVIMPVRERGATIAIFVVQSRRPRHWNEPELTFLRSIADRLEAGIARNRTERQQETLNREISHRLKNMLAMVQAIANQTLRRVVEHEPIDNFERRLLALGTAHDVLMQNQWTRADLADVLEASLATFGLEGRVDRDGPAVNLGSRASLSFALLIHELMTNAIKYGALSNDCGRVSIAWEIVEGLEEPSLIVRWRERGGPEVSTPTTKGFGSKLINLGLVGTGGVAVRYQPKGLEADMSAGISHIALS